MKTELSKISKIIEKEFDYLENYELELAEPDISSAVELPSITIKDIEEEDIDKRNKKA